MILNRLKKFSVIALTLTAFGGGAFAQQVDYCKGLKNPTSFVISNANNGASAKWYGFEGHKDNYTSSCGDWGMRQWGAQIAASQLESRSSGSNCTSSSSQDINRQGDTERRFVIKGAGTDPLTSNRLSYLPPDNSYTSSIRLGNNCGGTHEAEMLCYEFQVRPKNALIFIWYALSLQNGQHSISQNPEFAIEIEKNFGTPSNPNWQRLGGDTLCYIQPTPGCATGASSCTTNDVGPYFYRGTNGQQTSATYGENIYRPWNKVAINLNKYIYDYVRIKIGAGDCSMSVHYACAYIAGECQPMEILTSGCPAGNTTTVQTLTAPPGLENYVWYKCHHGPTSIPGSLYNVPDTVVFDRLTPLTSTNRNYDCQANDFRLPNGTYSSEQVFMCEMTSHMNPSYAITSKVYVRVNNSKPLSSIDTLKNCESTVLLKDKGYVPGIMNGCDTTLTRWTIHAGSMANSPVDTVIIGGSVEHTFEQAGTYAVDVRTFNRDSLNCYTDYTYTVKALGRPDPVLTLDQPNICEGERATLRDDTPGAVRHDWISHHDGRHDTLREGPATFILAIDSTYENPVELITYNGLYYEDSVITGLRHYCTDPTSATVYLFSHPEVLRTGDSIVCKGDKTRIHVEAKGIDSCTYKWYRQINGTTPIASGQLLQVAPYSDSCTYYVKVVSPQQCVAWDSVHAYLVLPTLRVDRNVICEGETVTLTSGAAASFSWSATPADALLNTQLDSAGNGPSVVTARPRSTTVYSLVGHGTNGCSTTPLTETVEVHPLPVARVSYDPLFVDSDNPVVTFNDVSAHGVATQWFFPNMEEPIVGSPYTHDFGEVSDDSVRVTLVSANDLGCTDTLKFRLPVELFTFYAPNVFTPDRPDNTVFRIYTKNAMEHFHVHIYDRKGRLMYTSDDLNFEWDGKSLEGTPCSQGTYVFVITYRRPNTEDIVTQKGTVTLLR